MNTLYYIKNDKKTIDVDIDKNALKNRNPGKQIHYRAYLNNITINRKIININKNTIKTIRQLLTGKK